MVKIVRHIRILGVYKDIDDVTLDIHYEMIVRIESLPNCEVTKYNLLQST